MYTYFITLPRREMAAVRTEDNVLDWLEEGVPVVGGRFPQATLVSLSRLALHCNYALAPNRFVTANSEPVFRLEHGLCSWLCGDRERLLDMSALWARDAYWQDVGENSMDLAGFLMDLAEVCQYAIAHEQEVYVLFIPGSRP